MQILLFSVVAAFLFFSPGQEAKADDGYRFVAEYIRELGTMERLRENAETENSRSQGNTSAIFSDCIRNSERFQLELNEYTGLLPKFKLRPDVQAVTSGLAKFYDFKTQIWQEISANCSAFLSAPQDGVDYSKLSANAPKLTAKLEYIDKSIFQTVPLVFAALIDQRPDKENHLSHLVITRAQRDELVRSINSYFGKKLDVTDQNYTVSAASVLRSYLSENGYKCADEAW